MGDGRVTMSAWRCGWVLAVAATAGWLALAATRWAWAGVTGAPAGPDLDAYVALGAAIAVDAVLGWVAVASAATVLAAASGWVGSAGAAVAERVAPAGVRRTVEVVLGVGLATGAVVPLATGTVPRAAVAAEAPGPAPTALRPATSSGPASEPLGAGARSELPGVDRPGYRPSTGTGSISLAATGRGLLGSATAPDGERSAAARASEDAYADLPGIDRPAAVEPDVLGTTGWVPAVPPPARPAAPPPADVRLVATPPGVVEATFDEVVVRRGDTLWAVAARALGPGADVAEVAAAWPRWYAANRDAIGPDPDLIRPGTVLVPPPPA